MRALGFLQCGYPTANPAMALHSHSRSWPELATTHGFWVERNTQESLSLPSDRLGRMPGAAAAAR